MHLVPRGLTRRLMLTYVLLVLVSVGGLMVWMGLQLQSATMDQEEHNLEVQAQLVANALRGAVGTDDDGSTSAPTLQSLVNAYAQESHLTANEAPARVTVVDNALHVLASSEPRVNHGIEQNHTEFAAARAGYELHEIRQDEYDKGERLFVAAAIRGDESLAAFVQLSISTTPIYASIQRMWLGLMGVGGLILALTALVSFVLARGIAKPVQNLTRTTEAIAQGHLERRVTPEGPDEIERLGRAFNSMAEQLQELITREKDFAAHAAHELRSPLTSLRLRLELLQNTTRTNPQITTGYLVQMEREVTHLQRVVEQLLALASLEEGMHAPRTNFDPAPLLYELTDELSVQVHEAGVQLSVEVPDHLPRIHANAEQVRMAARNLLENAFKYTPEHGVVTLRASVLKDFVEIAVSDTGVGIPEEALPHIFDRFYRADTPQRKGVRGSGLGLALTRIMVEANDGHITVTSEPGKGSVFTIQLLRERN